MTAHHRMLRSARDFDCGGMCGHRPHLHLLPGLAVGALCERSCGRRPHLQGGDALLCFSVDSMPAVYLPVLGRSHGFELLQYVFSGHGLSIQMEREGRRLLCIGALIPAATP